MSKERMLTALVLADVILSFTVIGTELMFNWTLPSVLRDYALPRSLALSGPWDFSLVMLWAATVLCTMVAWIGLLNLWWFARRLYLTAWGAWVLLLLLSGPSVMTPVGTVLSTVEAFVGGAIAGLIFFSELARQFERPVAQTSPA